MRELPPSKEQLLKKADQLDLYAAKNWYFNPQEYPWVAQQLRALAAYSSGEPFLKRRPMLEESDAWTSAEDERDWWRNYALQIERSAQPPLPEYAIALARSARVYLRMWALDEATDPTVCSEAQHLDAAALKMRLEDFERHHPLTVTTKEV